MSNERTAKIDIVADGDHVKITVTDPDGNSEMERVGEAECIALDAEGKNAIAEAIGRMTTRIKARRAALGLPVGN